MCMFIVVTKLFNYFHLLSDMLIIFMTWKHLCCPKRQVLFIILLYIWSLLILLSLFLSTVYQLDQHRLLLNITRNFFVTTNTTTRTPLNNNNNNNNIQSRRLIQKQKQGKTFEGFCKGLNAIKGFRKFREFRREGS